MCNTLNIKPSQFMPHIFKTPWRPAAPKNTRGIFKSCRLVVPFLIGLSVLSASQAQAPVDLRVALVIGNSAYAGNAALDNPTNDASAMSDVLRSLGFVVIEVRDGSRAQMLQAISKAAASLDGKRGIGMLYYAGHGLQLDWSNYMVPVDAKLASAADVREQTVDIGRVIEVFKQAGNRMNIVVLDACRNNPFSGATSGKGLAQLDAPTGTFLAYATAPGNVAEDGDAKANGLYTSYLLQELKKPVAKIEDVFKRVRLNVRQKSQGRQIPWESTSLEEDFYFSAGLKPTEKESEITKERLFVEEKADWEKIKASRNVDDFYNFLQKYPSANFSGVAKIEIERLQKSIVTAQLDRDGQISGLHFDGYRQGDQYEFVIKDGLTNVTTGTGKIEIRLRGDNEVEGVVLSGAKILFGARINRSSFVVQDIGGSYEPPYSVVPDGELQVGKRHTGRSIQQRPNGTRQWVDVDTKVVGKEILSTPFGLVNTFKTEVVQNFQNGSKVKTTYWFEPGWGYAVKYVSEYRGPQNGPASVYVREMISRSRRAA